ncbi:MAG TPA: flagellar basal body P-ring protein FlgI [Gemmataceae bacterium]|nr:flagellar basal body P-ring protein FlgI [Gemmataceae bacterium]
MNRLGRFVTLALGLAPLGLTGCFLKEFTTTVARPQAEDPPAKDGVVLIGQVANQFDNAQDMVVSGAGLVVGLNGTGGTCPPCDARTAVVERLKRDKVDDIAAVLDSPNSAVVVVTAVVKPGVRRDELIDVEVTLPQGSKVKSLRGGVLLPTPLLTFASQGEVRDYLKNSEFGSVSEGNRLLRGHEVVVAKGPLQAGLTGVEDGSPDSDKPLKEAFVWKGGKLVEGRAMYLLLNPDQQRFRIAEQIALRINETFHAGDTPGSKFALARYKDQVAVAVPPRYRLNRPHFMRVVRAIPLAAPGEKSEYVGHLEEQLQAPETALSAAVGLEAVGAAGVPALKGALKSEYPLVRFAAAEALAYLGQPTGAEVLAKIAAEHPSLQAYALTALAVADDALCQQKLEELMASKDPELKYGAFRAMREVDPDADLVKGVWARRSYVIHTVPVPGPGMVHLLREGRAEFVLFGETPKLTAPFSLTAGPEITVTAREGDTVATVSRFSARSETPTHLQCPLTVADILQKLADLGATYPDAAEFLRKAHDRKALDCRLVLDALPKAVPIQRLAKAAVQDPQMQQEYDLLAEVDAANAPNLFEIPAAVEKK